MLIHLIMLLSELKRIIMLIAVHWNGFCMRFVMLSVEVYSKLFSIYSDSINNIGFFESLIVKLTLYFQTCNVSFSIMVLFIFLTFLVAFINYNNHSLICMNQLHCFNSQKHPQLQKLKSINFISESRPLDKTIFILFSLVTRELWPHGLDSPLVSTNAIVFLLFCCHIV